MGSQDQPSDKAPSSQPILGLDENALEPSAASNSPNLVINTRFALEREIGRGGFGVTHLAADIANDRRHVVVKVLLEQSDAKTRNWIERHFRDEAKALARIDHPGVVKLIDSGETNDGRSYIAMEYVEGCGLRLLIEPEKGVGDFEQLARIIRQLGEAISAAHDQGVYHRDLKPENILLAQDGDEERVKIIDFGIATVKESLSEKTKMTVVAGSVRYLAPEQLQGRPSASSDIYALGVIAYEMITGRAPFNPDIANPTLAMTRLLEMQRAGVRVKPADLRPSLPQSAQDIVLRALAFDPSQRYQRADQFGDDLATALTGPEGEITGLDRPAALEMAYVLFMDIVGYSKLPMDHQTEYLKQLQDVVRDSPAFRQAQMSDRLISLPTGDGMALAFFGDPMTAVYCAFEVARSLKRYPHIKLRMGINMGPVYRIADINANRNVAGGGINMAQRVMDCGDAGHILVSHNVADMLQQLSEWQDRLFDLGSHPVKHGVYVHIHNIYTDEVGNPDIPEKLLSKDTPSPPVEPHGETGPSVKGVAGKRSFSLLPIAAVIVLIAVMAAVWWFVVKGSDNESNANKNEPAAERVRTLSYWGELQAYSNKKPSGDRMKLTGGIAGETYFNDGDGLTFHFIGSDDGFLYLIYEEEAAGGSGYYLLFPAPGVNNLSSEVKAGRQVATDENVFEEKGGVEKVWVVWSARQIDELEEMIRLWANQPDQGKIKDASKAGFVRGLLERKEGAALAETDMENERMNLRSKGEVLIYLLKLRHR